MHCIIVSTHAMDHSLYNRVWNMERNSGGWTCKQNFHSPAINSEHFEMTYTNWHFQYSTTQECIHQSDIFYPFAVEYRKISERNFKYPFLTAIWSLLFQNYLLWCVTKLTVLSHLKYISGTEKRHTEEFDGFLTVHHSIDLN
jgi:hypothetical protein